VGRNEHGSRTSIATDPFLLDHPDKGVDGIKRRGGDTNAQ